MTEGLEEASEHVQLAKDRAVEAREAIERDPGDERIEDDDVWDSINSALYDIDYALAKATWTTKDYLNQAADAADEGYDELVEELIDARKGLTELREDVSESRPSRAISRWLASLEKRLETTLAVLRGDGED